MTLLSDAQILAFGFSPGPAEMLVILGVALLLYGGRLPEMARSWGKTLAEFRRGLSGIQNDLNDAMYTPTSQLDYYPEEQAAPYSDDTVDQYRDDVDPSDEEGINDADAVDENAANDDTGEEAAKLDSPEAGTALDSADNPAKVKPSTVDTD